jgi:hypothetical protein
LVPPLSQEQSQQSIIPYSLSQEQSQQSTIPYSLSQEQYQQLNTPLGDSQGETLPYVPEENEYRPVPDEIQSPQKNISDELSQEPETTFIYDIPQNQDVTITEEELEELDGKEKSLRSKILNQPPPCQKKENSAIPFIEKVQRKTPLTDNEERISRQLKEQSNKAFLYFQPLIEIGKITTNTIMDCEVSDEIDQTNPTELIETKYKKTTEQTLTEFLKSQIPIQKQKNKFIQLLVHSHIQLLHAVTVLQSLTPQIIHFHISPETILYNTKDGTPVLTDFRLAFTKTELDDPVQNSELFPQYDNYKGYPFEIYILSQINSENQLDESRLKTLATQFAEMTELPIPTITPYQNNSIQTLIPRFYQSWDPYAINQYIYSFMTENNIPMRHTFMTSYKEILLSYLSAEPSQRPTIQKFQENIRKIFQSVPKKDYLEFLSALSME